MNTFLFLAVIALLATVLILAIVVRLQKKKGSDEFPEYEKIELEETVPPKGANTSDDRYMYQCALKLTNEIAHTGAIEFEGGKMRIVILKKHSKS